MIKLSNNQPLEFLAASGSLGFDGRGYLWERPWLWSKWLDPSAFTIVLKTLTYYERKGNWRGYNPHRVVKRLKGGGHVNSIGLTNPGFFSWFENVAPQLNPSWKFIVSIASTSIDEIITMAQRLNNFPLVAVEFNASCPNSVDHGVLLENTKQVVLLVQNLLVYSRHPIILKLSCQQDYLKIVEQLAGGIQAISINSVPWSAAFGSKQSPLPKKFGTGGVSGRAAQFHNWTMIRKLIERSQIPVIGASVWNYADLITLKKIGVGAVAFGSVFIRLPFYPGLPNEYINHWRKEYGEF